MDTDPIRYRIKLTYPTGDIRVIEFICPTWDDFYGVDQFFEDPEAPWTKVDEAGNATPNYEDIEYRKEFSKQFENRQFARIAHGLELAGNHIEGDDPVQRVKYLRRTYDLATLQKLLTWFNGLTGAIKAEVERVGDSFHPGTDDGSRPVGSQGVGLSEMEESIHG